MLNSKIGYMICETASVETPQSTIIKDSGRRLIAEVILQDMNVRNRNGRFYADKWMIPQLTCERQTELLSTGNLKGENGHPLQKDLARQQTIDPKCVSHKILKLWTKGNKIMGLVTGANTPWGDGFDQDLRDGEKPSFSLRALGTVKNTSRGAEVENVTIITWDRVHYPSHKVAYTQKIVNESASNIVETNNFTLKKNDHGLFVPINNKQVIDYIKQESGNLKSVMESFDTIYDSIVVLEGGNKVQLTERNGNSFIIYLENHITNELMDYCSRDF